MAHVGHFQVRPDYYPTVFLFFIISHSSGYFQHHSYEIISHGYQQKKNSQIINASGHIHHFHFSITGNSGLDICRKVERQDSKRSRARGLKFSASLLNTSTAAETFHIVVSKSSSTAHISGRASGLRLMILHIHSCFHASVVFTLK